MMVAASALQVLKNERLPARAAFKVHNIIRQCAMRLEDIETVRQKLLDSFATRDDAGERVIITSPEGESTIELTDENRIKFAAEYDALMEVDGEVTETISIAELETLELSPAMFGALGPLVTAE